MTIISLPWPFTLAPDRLILAAWCIAFAAATIMLAITLCHDLLLEWWARR